MPALQVSGDVLWAAAIGALALYVSVEASRFVARVWQLRRVAGPLHCRLCPLAFLLHGARGDAADWIVELHRAYASPTVIVAPDLVSTSGLDSIRTIYGHGAGKKPFAKESGFSRMLRFTHPHVDHLGSIADFDASARRRKVYSGLYSKAYLRSEAMRSLLDGVFERNRAEIKEKGRPLDERSNAAAAAASSSSSSFTLDYLRHARRMAVDLIASQIFGYAFVERHFARQELQDRLPEALDDALKDVIVGATMPPLYALLRLAASLVGHRSLAWIGAMAKLKQLVSEKCEIIYEAQQSKRATDTWNDDGDDDAKEAAKRQGERDNAKARQLSYELQTERCVVGDLHKASVEHATIVAEVLLHFAAGGDTVTNSACFVADAVLKSPEIKAKLEAELFSVFVEGPESPVTREDLERCTYLKQVIAESLRLTPTGPGPLPRMVPEHGAVVAGGIYLPPGTGVFVEAQMANHDPAVFEAPWTFDPARWDSHRVTPEMSLSVMTFSSGPRKCLGYELAWHELLFLTATLFLDYEVSRGEHTCMDHLVDYMTLRPVSGTCFLDLTPRTSLAPKAA